MAMAVYGMGVVLAPVVGPTLGRLDHDNYTWRLDLSHQYSSGDLLAAVHILADFRSAGTWFAKFEDGLKIDYIVLGLLAAGLGALEICTRRGTAHDWFASSGLSPLQSSP